MFHSRYVTRNFIFHTFQYTFTHCRIGVLAQRQPAPFPNNQRKPSGELMERLEAHLHARRNDSAMIASGSINKLVSDAGSGIYHQNILSGKLFIGSHTSRHAVVPKCLGRLVKVLHRKRCFFVQPQQRNRQVCQLRQHPVAHINNSGDNRFINRIFCSDFRQLLKGLIGVVEYPTILPSRNTAIFAMVLPISITRFIPCFFKRCKGSTLISHNPR